MCYVFKYLVNRIYFWNYLSPFFNTLLHNELRNIYIRNNPSYECEWIFYIIQAIQSVVLHYLKFSNSIKIIIKKQPPLVGTPLNSKTANTNIQFSVLFSVHFCVVFGDFWCTAKNAAIFVVSFKCCPRSWTAPKWRMSWPLTPWHPGLLAGRVNSKTKIWTFC